jgi:hypothetical protein
MAGPCFACDHDRLNGGDAMKTICPETLKDLADRWTVLINQIHRHGPSRYPDELCMYVTMLIRQTERLINPDPIEQDVFSSVRNLAERGELKLAMYKLHEVIDQRLENGES